ncbi:hypothetical protein COCON_G00151180 [Conger conger]|uniref:Uncharacterized protein n=1 Tax=Conger conger TaxID=82655 RepID=A0A9Q1HUH8_CONCO|nr:hypothetical protein COCON_G00151180 [Conger conger]
MPISSGATGRVGVGVDTSIMWTPDGWKQDANPLHRNCDSYLERYLETHPNVTKRSNIDTSVVIHEQTSNQGPKGKNRTTFSKGLNGGSNAKQQHESQDTTGNLSSESTSKSSTCAIL